MAGASSSADVGHRPASRYSGSGSDQAVCRRGANGEPSALPGLPDRRRYLRHQRKPVEQLEAEPAARALFRHRKTAAPGDAKHAGYARAGASPPATGAGAAADGKY